MFIAQPGVEKLESQAFEMYSQVQNYLSWTLLNVGGERVGHHARLLLGCNFLDR